MSSRGSAKEQEAVAQLAQHIMDQRAERWSQRTLNAYVAALKMRMGEIRVHQRQELSGAELFRTIARRVPVAWEDAPEEERALYNAAVRNFNNECEAEKQEHLRVEIVESVP